MAADTEKQTWERGGAVSRVDVFKGVIKEEQTENKRLAIGKP